MFCESFIILINVNSTRKIDVIETTFKIDAIEEVVQYYGFAAGDKLIFNLEEVNGKEIKEFEILELNSGTKFMDYKTKKIVDKALNIDRKGIYKFRFYNSAIGGRICKLKMQRIPQNDSLKGFNTNVYWKTIFDTTYVSTQDKYLIKSDTLVTEVYNSDTQISSQNAINGNLNRQLINFTLPKNTILWSFYISTGAEGKKAYDRMKYNYASQATSAVYKIVDKDPLAVLALTGVSYLIKSQGEDNVKYYIFNDKLNAQQFIYGNAFRYIKGGDVINELGRMPFIQHGVVYFGLVNDNTIDPILVTLKVVAIEVNHQYGTKEVQHLNISKRLEAYLK